MVQCDLVLSHHFIDTLIVNDSGLYRLFCIHFKLELEAVAFEAAVVLGERVPIR